MPSPLRGSGSWGADLALKRQASMLRPLRGRYEIVQTLLARWAELSRQELAELHLGPLVLNTPGSLIAIARRGEHLPGSDSASSTTPRSDR